MTKVKDLIAALQQLDPEAVVVEEYDGDYCPYEVLPEVTGVYIHVLGQSSGHYADAVDDKIVQLVRDRYQTTFEYPAVLV